MVRDAVQKLFHYANLEAEITGALASLLANPDHFRDHSVCCVITAETSIPQVCFDSSRLKIDRRC
jgi:hypothetical protein